MDDDVIKHYEFVAHLSLNTPLEILERHGDIHPGPHSDLPSIGDRRYGSWSPVTKSWAELAGPNAKPAVLKKLQEPVKPSVEDIRARLRKMGMSEKQLTSVTEETIGAMASEAGPVPKDGGNYLPFLKAFRSIMESSEPSESKRIKLEELKRQPYFERYATIHQKQLAKWEL